MITKSIPNGWHIDALPTGEYVCVIKGLGVETHLGFIPQTDNCLFPQIDPVGPAFLFSGQSNSTGKILSYNSVNWILESAQTYGISPIIFDNFGVRSVNQSPSQGIGAAGYRYCDYVTNQLITGDNTAGNWNNLNERTDVGDSVFIGQGNSGGLLLWDGAVNRVINATAAPRFIRARRKQGTNKVAISFWEIDGNSTKATIIQTDIAELKSLPIYSPIVDRFGPISQSDPNGTTVNDTTRYFIASDFIRDKDHLLQQVSLGDNKFAFVKFGDPKIYEILTKTDFGIEILEDCSNTQTARTTDTRWMPKTMKVGWENRFISGRHELISMNRSDCHEVDRQDWFREMWIDKSFAQFDCGPDLGIRKVIYYIYDNTNGAHDGGGPTGRNLELYIYAEGAGWLGWESHRSGVVFSSGKPVFNDASRWTQKLFYRTATKSVVPQLSGCAVNPPTMPTLKKPEITVIQWKPDATVDGWVFEGIDRENPGFGFKVWTENGSYYSSFTNPVGSGRTGAVRPYKKCSTTPPIPPVEPPTIPPGTISRIRVDNLVFRDEQNNIFPYRGFSSFLLFKRFLDGEDIRPYLSAWSGIGYNIARVFGQCDWTAATGLPSLIVANYPNYYTALPNFLNLLSQHGLYCELVAHTYPYNLQQQVDYVNNVAIIGKQHKNFFLELTNEPSVNGIDIDGIYGSINISTWNFPWSTGQYENAQGLALPKGSYITTHLDRGNEWPRKFRQLLEYRQGGGPNNPTDPAMNCPIVHDEPIGGWDENIPGRRSNVPTDFHSHGAGCQLHGAGATYHHESGRASILPDGLEWDCAKAFITGLRLVDVKYQLGEYARIGLSNCPFDTEESLGTWGMIVGNTACMVRVRPHGVYTVKSGWQVTSQDSQGIVVTLVRV